MQLSNEQQEAVDGFVSAIEQGRSQYTIAGLAGTGKTTVIRALIDALDMAHDYAVCTPTGKAAHVLRTKGVEAQTLHSLLYYPREDKSKGKVDFVDNDEPMPDIVIVDEASMLTVRMVEDLRARVRFVCYVGDHGQLEPVGDDPELMKHADFVLKQIHRQAEGSGIITFAHRMREGLAPLSTGPEAQVLRKAFTGMHNADVILVARNATRARLNRWVRTKRGFAGALPEIGEQVICLRNNSERRVFNGMTGRVVDIEPGSYQARMSVETDDGLREDMPIMSEQFGREKTLQDPRLMRRDAPTLWDFGYALTAHKSQGSEWPTVVVYDECPSNWDLNRWRYTAATRASKQLYWYIT